MNITCLSDCHGYYPKLDGGDLLIVAGDLTATDSPYEYNKFAEWIMDQQYKNKVVIAGNHDNFLQGMDPSEPICKHFTYLCDSGIEFEGIKIWGSPWTKSFLGMNPRCKAFTVDTEEELAEKWALIPHDVDILITHCPPYGIFDVVHRQVFFGEKEELTGSLSLRNKVMDEIQPRLHIFGHIHEWGGRMIDTCVTKFVNASHVNERYEPVNKPIRIVL